MPNDPPPSKSKVVEHVIWFLASTTLIKPERIKVEYVLKEAPLNLDDKKLGNLTLQLRGYVQRYRESATILASEVRKKGLTVGALATLVHGKIE